MRRELEAAQRLAEQAQQLAAERGQTRDRIVQELEEMRARVSQVQQDTAKKRRGTRKEEG
jgi:soluble cytochrome b562